MNDKSFKFAILHINHFVELSFKYFIIQIHPILVYHQPYTDKELEKQRTLSINEAINFYKNTIKNDKNKINLLTKTHLKDIDWLKKIRNDIEHFKFELDIPHVKNSIGKILSILNEIFKDYGIELARELSEKYSDLYNTLINDYTRELYIAEKNAQNEREINHITKQSFYDKCTYCGYNTQVYREKSNEFYCHYCKESVEAKCCDWCNELFPFSEAVESIVEGIYFCNSDCFDKDIDRK
jgi:hypothetical protein